MNLSGHSLATTFDAPPAFGGALASTFHLQIDGVHAATLHVAQSERNPLTVRARVTAFEHEILPELSRFAASVLAQTREIEDLRGDTYAGNDARSELYWRDTHARDGYPRALLARDRFTGELFQSPNIIAKAKTSRSSAFACWNEARRGSPSSEMRGLTSARRSSPRRLLLGSRASN